MNFKGGVCENEEVADTALQKQEQKKKK